MKLVVALALVALVAARPEENVYSRLEKIDVNDVISNVRLLESYFNCLLGTGKCTPEGNELKEIIPESIQSNCGQCTDKQKTLVGRVMKACMEKLPGHWEKMKKLHNPDGKYDDSLKEFLEKYGQ